VLAIVSAVGLKSFLAHRIWCAVIGSAAVVVCGLVGREMAGRRVGLIAAFLVAVYPNLWMSDELGLSETLTPVVVALVLLAAYRFWNRPDWVRALWLGVSIGVAALARDELGLLALLLLAPLALSARTLSWGRRATVLAVGGLAALVTVAPWVGYNLSRFQDPVFISSGLGVTLASANCDTTYQGPFEGYWSYQCALAAPLRHDVDESVQGSEAQRYALHYVRTHTGRIVPVELARFGRSFGLFHPLQQIHLDSMIETRPYRWALVGLGMYYCMLPLAIGGAVLLRRRRVPVLPLLAVGLDVVVSTAISFGNTRYRTAFEVPLILASAVMLEWIWRSGGGHNQRQTAVAGEEASRSEASGVAGPPARTR
jgi:4-amino-4-deoxy-L-arabinose transferase-like glycosyltransferase